MKLALIAVAAATLATACVSANAPQVANRGERDRSTALANSAAYIRADNGDPGGSVDNSRNPADSGSRN